MSTVGQWLTSINPAQRLEGELLLAEHLNLSRTQIIAFPETDIDAERAAKIDRDMNRVCAGEPLAYVLGNREFFGLEFEVSPAVLVPRPETELLVEQLRDNAPRQANVLELGTGSGAIAIALAHERGDLSITATDVSSAALAVARANAARLRCEVAFIESNWFDQVHGMFDIVVSNPPYIPADDPHLVDLAHEPHLALVAEDNGLAALRHIAQHAPSYLTPGGLLLLEHGYDQGAQVVTCLSGLGYREIKAHYDLAEHHRATSARTCGEGTNP